MHEKETGRFSIQYDIINLLNMLDYRELKSLLKFIKDTYFDDED